MIDVMRKPCSVDFNRNFHGSKEQASWEVKKNNRTGNNIHASIFCLGGGIETLQIGVLDVSSNLRS